MNELIWFLAGCALTAVLLLWLRARTPRRRETRQRPLPRRIPERPRPAPRRIELSETRSLEDLSATLGAELASLASGVEGHAQLLCESLGSPTRVAKQSEHLWESVRHLRFFSEKMQSFARVPQLSMGPVDTGLLLSALVREIEDYSRGNLQVHLAVARSAPLATANPEALRTAILFLIESVLVLEPNSSSLLLQAQPHDGDEDSLELRIDIEAALDEAEDAVPRPAPPVMFSYLAANNLLRAQRGHVTLDHTPGLSALASVALEATTTVSEFEIPDPPEADGTPHRFGGVLIMEGNPAIRDMLARELDKTSRNVIVCADGAAAKSLFDLTPERFELLILELESRRVRGEDLARAALLRNEALQVILIAPGPGTPIAADLALLPNVHVLRKPFGIMELRSSLTETLGPEPKVDAPAAPFPAETA